MLYGKLKELCDVSHTPVSIPTNLAALQATDSPAIRDCEAVESLILQDRIGSAVPVVAIRQEVRERIEKEERESIEKNVRRSVSVEQADEARKERGRVLDVLSDAKAIALTVVSESLSELHVAKAEALMVSIAAYCEESNLRLRGEPAVRTYADDGYDDYGAGDDDDDEEPPI